MEWIPQLKSQLFQLPVSQSLIDQLISIEHNQTSYTYTTPVIFTSRFTNFTRRNAKRGIHGPLLPNI